MDSTDRVRSQSGWLAILKELDNVPCANQEDRENFRGFFKSYWTFIIQEGAQSPPIAVGHIADWLVDRVRKAIFLDAKYDAAQPRSADSEGTKALRALNMELLDDGGIPGFDRFHRKSDRCQIPGILGRIEIDRNAAQLFGLVTMGPHMEAALSRDFVTENTKATSILRYYNQCSTAEGGHMRPRVLHTLELELLQDMVPRPHDGEVSEFLRMDAQVVRETIMAGEMTDDAAIVWLDFLVRHGIVDEQNEPDLRQITDRMHRHLPFSTIMA